MLIFKKENQRIGHNGSKILQRRMMLVVTGKYIFWYGNWDKYDAFSNRSLNL